MEFLKTHNKNLITHFLGITLLSLTASLSILYLQTKVIAILILLPIIFIFWINSAPISKIALTVFAITFPITIQFMEKDAMSTGTLLIFLLFAWNIVSLNRKQIYNANLNFLIKIISMLFIISIVGVISKTPSGYYGPAIRHLVNFGSSVLLFLTVIKAADLPGMAKTNRNYIEKILSILLLVISLHILLSLLFFLFPDLQDLFKIFFHRTQTHLGTFNLGQFERAASIFTAGEELGELLAVLFPFVLYKAFTNNRYTFLLLFFFIGLFISGTRSAALLVLFELVIFFFMTQSKGFGGKKILLIITALFVFGFGSNFILDNLDILFNRFQETTTNIKSNANFMTILNRHYVWEGAWDTTWRTLSVFGHGPIQAVKLGMNKGYPNFHCLYLTLIFQYGIIGFSIFIVFFSYLIKRLISKLRQYSKKDPYYSLILACILSLMTFLINEVKFEFNRGDSYQQFIWIVFAIFFLVGKTIKKKHEADL